MRHRRDQVGAAIAVDVEHVDEARLAKLEIGVERPRRGGSRASNQPVGTMISARPSLFTSPAPMPWPNDFSATLCPTNSPLRTSYQVSGILASAEFREHFARLTVVIQVDQESELDRRFRFDRMVFPQSPVPFPGFSLQ